jgi:hypothetical protein
VGEKRDFSRHVRLRKLHQLTATPFGIQRHCVIRHHTKVRNVPLTSLYSAEAEWHLNFKKPTSTVIAAILDKDNTICQRVLWEGVCMFGRQIKFIRAGDHASLIQCAQCHELGHNASSHKCGVPKGESRCYICGRGHKSQHHSFECTGPHKTPGTCGCIPKCLLCKQSGHTACDKTCSR